MTSRTIQLVLVIVVVLGAALRFQAVGSTIVDSPIRADARIYYLSALNIKHWGVFSQALPGEHAPQPSAFVPPGLPFAILPFVEYPPSEYMLFRINSAQALLSTLTIILAYLFFRGLGAPGLALGAATLTAISPHLVVMNTYLLTETLFTFLLMGGLCALAYGVSNEKRRVAVLGGCLLGFSALTRATTEYLPLFLAPVLYWGLGRSRFLRFVLPALVLACAIVVAWKIRNFLSIHAFSDPTLMVSTVHHGMYPDFMFNDLPESRGRPYRFDPFSTQAGDLATVLAELWRRASADPLRYVGWYFLGKPTSLLSWENVDGVGDVFVYPIFASPYLELPLFQQTRLVMLILHKPLTLLALVGLGLAILKPAILGLTEAGKITVMLICALLIYFFAVHMLGAPFPRYGIPLRPLVYGFGLFTFFVLLARLRGRFQE